MYGSYVLVMQIVKIDSSYSKRIVHYQPQCTIPYCSCLRVEFGAQWDVEIRDSGNKSLSNVNWILSLYNHTILNDYIYPKSYCRIFIGY